MNKAFHVSSSALLIAACLGLPACQDSASLGEDLGVGLAGVCATGQLATFAANQNQPDSLALTGQQVFWFNSGAAGDMSIPTQVMKAPESGGAPTPLASSGPVPAGVDPTSNLSAPVFDDHNLYWMRFNYGGLDGSLVSESVLSMPQSGGPTTLLTTSTTDLGFLAAVDTDGLYFVAYDTDTAHTALLSMPTAGGATTALASLSTTTGDPFSHVYGLIVDADHVYWSYQGDVMSVAKGGGSPVVLAPHENPAGAALVQDEGHLYWAGNGEVRALAKSGGAPVTLAAAITEPDGTGVIQTQSIITDGACFYSTSPTDHALMAVRKSGGTFAPVALIPAELRAPSNWVADQTGVYVADFNGFVLKLAH